MNWIFRPRTYWPPWQPPKRFLAPEGAGPGTTYTLTAPSPASGSVSVVSQNFTVTPNGIITAVITPSDSGMGGTFTPTSRTFTASSASQTFTYTPFTFGIISINTTNNGGLSDPSSVNYTSIRTVAETYYISNTSPTGNDSADGLTPSTPWLTVDKVNNWSQLPDDVYSFHGGNTFSDATLIPPASGIQGHPITYTSYGTGLANIATGATDRYGLFIQDLSFVTVENLSFTGPGFTGSGFTLATISTHAGVQMFSSAQDPTAQLYNVNLDNVSVSGFTNGIQYMTRSAGVSGLSGPYWPRNGSTATARVVGFSNCSITNCTVDGVFNSPLITLGGYPAGGGPGWDDTKTTFLGFYIANCVFKNTYGFPAEHSVAPNIVALINMTGCTFERNVVHDSGQYAGAGACSAGPGSIVTGQAADIVVQWCEIYNTTTFANGGDGTGIDFDYNTTNCIAQNNFTHDNDGAGLVSVGASDCRYRYNISYNDARKSAGAIIQTGLRNWFYNNTVYLNSTGTTGSPACINLNSSTADLFLNNILISTGNAPLVNGTLGTAFFAGNLYYPSGGTLHIGGQTSLAAWQGTGQETVGGLTFGIVADPLLVGAGSFGSGVFTSVLPAAQVGTVTAFDLTGSSPCIGAGVDWSLLGVISGSFDFHGYPNRVIVTRPPDIGACTYGASSLVPSFWPVAIIAGARSIGTF